MEEFKREMKTLTVRLKEAENRAENAEKSVKRLQKEVDRLEGKFQIMPIIIRSYFDDTCTIVMLYTLLNIFDMMLVAVAQAFVQITAG